MLTSVICMDLSILKVRKIVRKISNFLSEVLLDICCKAIMLLQNYTISEWNVNYVKSEPNVTYLPVNPVTGIVDCRGQCHNFNVLLNG